jgi:hypothetical protein
MQVVGCGVDTLVIGFAVGRYLDVNKFEALAEAKVKAGDKLFDGKGRRVEWFGIEFSMMPRGSLGYEWVMRNADVLVCVAREAKGGSVMPEVYVTFSSLNLSSNGIEGAVRTFIQWLSEWAVTRNAKVSRADLYIDVGMPFPNLNIQKEIVSRARFKVGYSEPLRAEHYVSGRRETGYRFGRGDLCARFYDKTHEVTLSGKEWMREKWMAQGWEGTTPVVRFEFQCRRKFLKEMSVDTFEDLRQRAADIWRYCTSDWLRVCDPGSKRNQARWKSKDYWALLQRSFTLFGQTYGVLRVKARQIRYDRLLKQVEGCAASAVAALAPGVGMATALFKLEVDLRAMPRSEGFLTEVARRRASMASMEKPVRDALDGAIKIGARMV